MSQARYELFGRGASHYTRLVRIVAHEAAVELVFRPVSDIKSQDPSVYGGHPGLKMPALRIGEERVFGAIEICRRLVAASPVGLKLVWPEALPADLRNAWELLAQAMQAQVQLVMGISVCGLPADNPFFAKSRRGMEGSLNWLEERLVGLLAQEPPGDLSLFRASVFCLLEHLRFRRTLEPLSLPRLEAMAEAFAARPSAAATPYRVDGRPEA